MRGFLLSILPFVCYTICVAQTIYNPVFERTDRSLFHIDKIELFKDSTYIYGTIDVPQKTRVNISPFTFIQDDITKRKYTILRCEGIPFSPHVRNFDNAVKCNVTFVFPSIAKTTQISLIESPEGKGFNVYGLSLIESFNETYSLYEFDRLSNMADFWTSSGNSDKSIDIKKKELEASKYLFGINSNLFISEMYNLSNLYYKYGNYNEALIWKKKFADKWYAICKNLTNNENVYGEKEYYMSDIELFSERQYLAFRYFIDNHKWNEAKTLMQNVYQLFKENNDTTIYIPCIEYYIGLSSFNEKDEEGAKTFYLKSYNSFQNHERAKEFPVYGELLCGLSLIYSYSGDYEKSYKYAVEATNACRLNSGENSKEFGFALTALSNAEIMLNKKEEGLKHAELASSIIEKANDAPLDIKEFYRKRIFSIKNLVNGGNNFSSTEPNDSVDSITAYLFEANDEMVSGDYHSAIEKFKIIKENQEIYFESVDLQSYIRVIVSLSDCLSQTGKLTEADKVLDDALNTLSKNNTKTSMVRYIYASKGLLYFLLNNYISSYQWCQKALDLFRRENDKSLSYARLLGNISMLNIQIGLYDEAKKQLDEALDICKNFYDKTLNNNDFLSILNNIATNYIKMGDKEKGVAIYKAIIENANGNNTLRIKALAMCNLGEIYMLNNEMDSAKKIWKDVLQFDVDGYIKEIVEVDLLLCRILDNDVSSEEDLNTFNNNVKRKIFEIIGGFTESEREKYWNKWSEFLTILNNLAVSIFETPKTRQMAYNNALLTKNMLVNSSRLLRDIVKETNIGKEMFATMQEFKDKLSHKNVLKDSINYYVGVISQLEKKIIKTIPNFSDELQSQFKSYEDVRQMLSDKDVAIEFIYLPHVKFPIETTELSYGALVLTKNDEFPRLITLCKEEDLEHALRIGDSLSISHPHYLYNIASETLYKLIWSKIVPFINKGSNIYYSPTGYINRVNLSAISDGTHRLEELYNFYEVTSTATIVNSKITNKEAFHNIVLYGDINYSEDVNNMEYYAQAYSSCSSGKMSLSRSNKRGAWDLLPGTKKEIEHICRIANNCGMTVKVFSNEEANEESFKSLHGKSPHIIHVATHGFYFPDKNAKTAKVFNDMHSYTLGDDPLLYSGLLFAGANNVWAEKKLKEGLEDGILTADEISRLDLSNTHLVVLSACDTGLGYVDKINGIFGLQRGFKKAGVESVLMSLWKVDDEATRILMVEFYRNLMSGKTKWQSLKDAQMYLRIVDDGKYNDPKYWAPFIMLDGLN